MTFACFFGFARREVAGERGGREETRRRGRVPFLLLLQASPNSLFAELFHYSRSCVESSSSPYYSRSSPSEIESETQESKFVRPTRSVSSRPPLCFFSLFSFLDRPPTFNSPSHLYEKTSPWPGRTFVAVPSPSSSSLPSARAASRFPQRSSATIGISSKSCWKV